MPLNKETINQKFATHPSYGVLNSITVDLLQK